MAQTRFRTGAAEFGSGQRRAWVGRALWKPRIGIWRGTALAAGSPLRAIRACGACARLLQDASGGFISVHRSGQVASASGVGLALAPLHAPLRHGWSTPWNRAGSAGAERIKAGARERELRQIQGKARPLAVALPQCACKQARTAPWPQWIEADCRCAAISPPQRHVRGPRGPRRSA